MLNGEAHAAFDARQAGLTDAALEGVRNGDHSHWPHAEKAALEFARKMTVESTKVTDEEFASLAKSFGDKKTAAMVLIANGFQLSLERDNVFFDYYGVKR